MGIFKHAILVILAIPFLPYLIFQGYSIRKKIPNLSPPKDITGTIGSSDSSLNLLCIGESTIAGVGVKTHTDGIAGQLANYLFLNFDKKINWEAFAKSGITTKELINKIKTDKINSTPNIIIIGIGANDGFRLNSPLIFNKNVAQIINTLKNKFPSSILVFANVPPISLFPAFPKIIKFFVAKTVEIYRKELIKIVEKHDNVYFDKRKIEDIDWGHANRPSIDFFSDGVHPSKLTYSLWAKNISEFIFENNILQTCETVQP